MTANVFAGFVCKRRLSRFNRKSGKVALDIRSKMFSGRIALRGILSNSLRDDVLEIARRCRQVHPRWILLADDTHDLIQRFAGQHVGALTGQQLE